MAAVQHETAIRAGMHSDRERFFYPFSTFRTALHGEMRLRIDQLTALMTISYLNQILADWRLYHHSTNF